MSSDPRSENPTPFIVAQPGSAVALPPGPDTLGHVRRAAVFLAAGVLATTLGAGAAPRPHGSVPACTAAAVRAIEHHVPVASVTAACRSLSRSELNFALGRAIFDVAGAGHHKTAWRRRAVAAGARLARLIESGRRPAGLPPGAASPAPSPGGPASRWGLGLSTLAAWLLTVGSGAFMLAGWIRGGGLRRRAGRSRLGPVVTLGHFGVASTGLLIWIAYLATGWAVLAWLAVGVLVAAVGFGMATLTVWSSRARTGPPGPAAGPPEQAAGPPGQAAGRPGQAPGPRRASPNYQRVIIPIVHGLTASATVLLALLTVVSV